MVVGFVFLMNGGLVLFKKRERILRKVSGYSILGVCMQKLSAAIYGSSADCLPSGDMIPLCTSMVLVEFMSEHIHIESDTH